VGNVLFVVQRVLPGGTESHVLSLATALRQRGHKVGLFTSGGPWLNYFRQAGVKIHETPGFLSIAPALPQLLRSVLLTHKYTVLHVHDSPGLMLLNKVQVPRHVRVVATIHGTYIAKHLLTRCRSKVHMFIAVSPAVKTWMVRTGIPAYKVDVIANGISTTRFSPGPKGEARRTFGIPQNAFVIGYAGRFTVNKRPVSLRIARQLQTYCRTHRNVYILVAGNQSRSTIGKWKSGRFLPLGSIAHMPTFYRACDLVVGTGRVALEALASGRPTISVGESMYIGRLGVGNFDQAVASNFGDQGPRFGWQPSRLHADINLVVANRTSSFAQAQVLRKKIVRRFSLNMMSARVQKHYRF